MTGPAPPDPPEVAREIAPDVFCLGPWGRTQTVVYFVRSGSSWVMIDAGWTNDASRIERAAGALFGVASRPAAILLTHDHPDHEGSAMRLARLWDCPVYMHPAELPIATRDFAAMVASAGPLDRWIVLPLMRAVGKRRREALFARSSLRDVARAFDPTAGVPGLPEWECIPTPGHTPGHVSYFRPADRVLISGDAVVTFKIGSLSGLIRQQPGLSGPPWYTTWNRRAVRESIDRLARLRPTVLAGGHGIPMTGAETAAALRAFAGLADPKDKSTLTPQDYSARTGYRPPAAWYQRLNRLGVPLTSLGLAPRDAVTLEVRGRTSGKPRRIPILRTRFRGEDYLVSLSGESQWVRNVRAADGRAVIRRRKARPVRLEELPTVDRPEIIAEYLRAGRARSGAEANAKQARYYFGLGPTPTIDDIRTIADYYPVFRVVYSDDQATRLIGQQAHTKSASIPPEDTGSA